MNKQGQSIVEYSLIAILVILGIVFMGPYVLRSIDAHFKLWDEGTQDSFQENLKQASLNSIPYMNSDCECTQSTGTSCGGPGLACPATEHEIDWNCTPYQGCNGAAGTPTCSAPDISCCGCPQPSGCGTATLPAIPIPANDLIPVPCPTVSSNVSCTYSASTCYCPVGSTYNHSNCPAGTPSTVSCCSPATTASPCYYGYQIYNYQCGATTPSICVPDPNCPAPLCQGTIEFPPSTVFCAGSLDAASANLTKNTSFNFVKDRSACNGSPCQVYCVAPYAPNNPPGTPLSSANACILAFVVASNDCSYDNSSTTCPTCSNIISANEAGDGSASCTCNACYSPYYCPGSHNCRVNINNESFTVCSSGLPIASVIANPGYPTAANPLGPPGLTDNNVCGSPEGMPGNGCNVDISWGNNNS